MIKKYVLYSIDIHAHSEIKRVLIDVRYNWYNLYFDIIHVFYLLTDYYEATTKYNYFV